QQLGGCGRVHIVLSRLEEIVTERVLHTNATPAFAALLAESTSDGAKDTAAMLRRLREDEGALEQLTKDHYVARAIPRPAFLAAKDALERRIEATQTEIARASSPLLAIPSGVDFEKEWAARGPEW